MKKLNTLKSIYVRNFSNERNQLLAQYKTLLNEEIPYAKPDNLELGEDTRCSSFGIEILSKQAEIWINLPLHDSEKNVLEFNFNCLSSNPELIWQAILYDENKKPLSNPFSLRTPHPEEFQGIIHLEKNAALIKLEPNFGGCLIQLSNLTLNFHKNFKINDDPICISHPKHRAIICFPIIDWEYRTQRPQHIMRKLAEEGNHIVYLSTRLYGFHHDQAVFENLEDRVTKVHLPGNYRLNLYKDSLTSRSIAQAYQALTRFLLERAFEDVVTVCHLPFWYPLAKKLKEDRGYPIIYDCMDDHAGFENNTPKMLELEHDLCEKSDLIITSSKLLYDKKSTLNPNCSLIRNAGEVDHFKENPQKIPEELKKLEGPTIGYFGAIAEWFDIEAIKQAAILHPEWNIVLIGHYEDSTKKQFSQFKNISLLGELPYLNLPAYLYNFDVCTIPFLRIPLTEATNPVKIYEYFASGKPVVSRRLPEVEEFSDVTYLYDEALEFVTQVEQALLETKTDTKINQRKEIAQANTWTERALSFSQQIDKLQKKVSIIIVSYEALAFIRACVTSILKNTDYKNYEVVIVDNNSSDLVVSYLKELENQYPSKIRLILNDHNAGFAKANNQGIKASPDSDYYVLLNNDTEVPSGWLSRLVYYASQPEIGMVGPITNNIGNEAQIHTEYKSMEEMGRVSWGIRNQFQGEIFDIKVLAMFCVAFRKEIVETVGYLDEDFTIGMFEDDDYAQRIRSKGLRVICAEDVFVHHHGSVSFKQIQKEKYAELFEKNKKIFEKKWGPWVPHTYR